MRTLYITPILAALSAVAALPAFANSLVSPGSTPGIARSKLSARPAGEWNRLSGGNSKNVEIWTIDGDALNKVSFFAGIESGKPLMREPDRKHQPLPKVSATMLITDIPLLLESTYRSVGVVNQMNIDRQEPATIGGRKAIRFTYGFTSSGDEVRRSGEGIGAMVDGKLYLVTYEAPTLHFFDKDVEKFRQLASTLTIDGVR